MRTAGRRRGPVLPGAELARKRYATWFIQRWGGYENPWLDDVEHLDLRSTYIPLSFRARGAPDEVAIATDVLTNEGAGNLIIEGAPGSGKSTLLKAYGVALLEQGSLRHRGRPPVPFLVQLRKLARFLDIDKDLTDYLIDDILVASAGIAPRRARRFLTDLARRGQVIVMLDGLDEVTADRYQAVLEAVYHFMNDGNPECPTRLARMLLTCRRQNFLAVRDDWVPSFHGRECSLVPLRNSEIFSYLDRVRRKFREPDGPERFMKAITTARTLDLLRAPVILAMAVGLYSRRQYPTMLSSTAELYQIMIREMLDRHGFQRDPSGSTLRFQVDDKYRFLREFALHTALRSRGFEEFTRSELVEFANRLAPQLDAVTDPAALVDEVITRSGLLADVGDGGMYIFVQRSIHEYLVAEALRADANGEAVLLRMSADPEWRQVAKFYSADYEQHQMLA